MEVLKMKRQTPIHPLLCTRTGVHLSDLLELLNRSPGRGTDTDTAQGPMGKAWQLGARNEPTSVTR